MTDDRLAARLDPVQQPGWRLQGAKTFITSGMRADHYLVAARTAGTGAEGIDRGERPATQIALAKNRAARVMRDCAGEAVQILGGAGCMRGTRVERIHREAKVMMIGGGAEEVLAEFAARQLGVCP